MVDNVGVYQIVEHSGNTCAGLDTLRKTPDEITPICPSAPSTSRSTDHSTPAWNRWSITCGIDGQFGVEYSGRYDGSNPERFFQVGTRLVPKKLPGNRSMPRDEARYSVVPSRPDGPADRPRHEFPIPIRADPACPQRCTYSIESFSTPISCGYRTWRHSRS